MQQMKLCSYCKKPAQYQCGYCRQTTYCSYEHQKTDWPNHKKVCAKSSDKVKQLIKTLTVLKKSFSQKQQKRDIEKQCCAICNNMRKISKEILERQPSPIHQIQYGIAVCCYVRMLYIQKNFSQSNSMLDKYIKQKYHFLKDTSMIPSTLELNDQNYNQLMHFAKCKLKLLSTISSLNHMSRSSTESIEILLAHCEKLYGANSPEVSNVYFQMGNYFNKLGEYYKAIACFLVAARMRGENGAISYFNAAMILITKKEQPEYHKAVDLLQKYCLKIINATGDEKNIVYRVYIALAFCYRKLNNFDKTKQYIEKALCQVNLRHRFENKQHQTICSILKILDEEYKKQFTNDQLATLNRQILDEQQEKIISTINIQNFKEAYIDTTKKNKQQQWLKSFTNAIEKTKYQSKIPMTNPLVEKHLFVNHFIEDKNQQIANKQVIAVEHIKIDQQYMISLTALEVKSLNELNKILNHNKDKSSIPDIVEGSNFKRQVSEQKMERLYSLNPQFIKQKTTYQMIEDEVNNKPTNKKNSNTNQKINSNNQQIKNSKNLTLDMNKVNQMQKQN